jgi:hypothetical protein
VPLGVGVQTIGQVALCARDDGAIPIVPLLYENLGL